MLWEEFVSDDINMRIVYIHELHDAYPVFQSVTKDGQVCTCVKCYPTATEKPKRGEVHWIGTTGPNRPRRELYLSRAYLLNYCAQYHNCQFETLNLIVVVVVARTLMPLSFPPDTLFTPNMDPT